MSEKGEEMKNAIVTGSSSGFGLLIAMELARSGFKVTATMRNPQKAVGLQEIAAAEKLEGNLCIHPLDVTCSSSIEEFKVYLQSLPSVDVLVNNAGFAQGGFSEELSLEDYRKQFDTNFFGVVAVTQAVLPYMRKQGSGKIINMSSISGRFGFPGLSAYSASKHALEGYSESLRLELKPFGIDVVLIEPGSYKTNIWESVGKVTMKENSPYEPFKHAILDELKKGEAGYGNPVDVARLAARIASADEDAQFRYPIGIGVKTTINLKHVMPWKVIEKIVMRKLKFSQLTIRQK
ncbi:SDR family oxidoreductase [Mesobacillus subterraneus]|uniref:SDR family oxidoreductase n=1 Tax=Mesobacillus subterraneus TaxID=285983 RepID=A0A3R9EYZ5_9BACI|nr:SDR family oxidoreductase [Mesobacillus subterraneus]RSD25399.1 SDR family oxidoreductase [Mesobacillus subterraneus]